MYNIINLIGQYKFLILKIFGWILALEITCNFVMQFISYSFYRLVKKEPVIRPEIEKLDLGNGLSGYAKFNWDKSGKVIIYFGGSGDIAYNSVFKYANKFPGYSFVSVDYYGSQDSIGRMNLKTMKHSAVQVYDFIRQNYPDAKIIVMGHSYASGIAAYLASQRPCSKLIMIAGYRDVSDLYNKMIPIFWGPFKLLITNNIRTKDYAAGVEAKTMIITSDGDKTLSNKLQYKLATYFRNAEVKAFPGIAHTDYLFKEEVVSSISEFIGQ
jgi:pimeloyl-ACP methyl ester carboxylesterase